MVEPSRTNTNRDALLEGALLCLQERGYARTTARDIVAASGTNLGAIGYHYGSTEALLNRALLEGFERWFAEFTQAATQASHENQSLVTVAVDLHATFESQRPLVRALFEAIAQADQSEEIRAGLIEAYRRGRDLTVDVFELTTIDGPHARVLASLLIAVFDGLLIQWLIDPENSPTGEDLRGASIALTALLSSAREP